MEMNCFAGDSVVATPTGQKTTDRLQVGDLVSSYAQGARNHEASSFRQANREAPADPPAAAPPKALAAADAPALMAAMRKMTCFAGDSVVATPTEQKTTDRLQVGDLVSSYAQGARNHEASSFRQANREAPADPPAAAPPKALAAADAPALMAAMRKMTCFAGDSVVATPTGQKTTDRLQVGDLVSSYAQGARNHEASSFRQANREAPADPPAAAPPKALAAADAPALMAAMRKMTCFAGDSVVATPTEQKTTDRLQVGDLVSSYAQGARNHEASSFRQANREAPADPPAAAPPKALAAADAPALMAAMRKMTCFAGDSVVATPTGQKTTDRLQVGDLVSSYAQGARNHEASSFRQANREAPADPPAAAPPKALAAADAPALMAAMRKMTCFAGDSVVATPTGQKTMDRLQVGDLALVPSAGNVLKYERVETFYHREPETRAQFVVIITESGRRMALTPLHLLPVGDCQTVNR